MDSTPSYKISISSHVNYRHAIDVLFQSFQRNNVSRKDVIVTICGRSNEPPEIVETGPDTETIIYVPTNCYEMSQAYGIHLFADHPRVRADYYITFHDTSIITQTFTNCMNNYAREMKKRDVDVLYALKTKQLNLVGLSYKFMKEHGHNYNRNIDKPAAWVAEHGRELSYLSFVPPDKVSAIDCEFHYQGGTPLYSDIIRHPVYVASMGIIKFVGNATEGINPPWQERHRP